MTDTKRVRCWGRSKYRALRAPHVKFSQVD
ncbi:MAG TPA: hypothetical protein DIU14_04490, partial [Actinobacteria bacterium]|nr:hypothetical protein [Actinomycetota bacterium]